MYDLNRIQSIIEAIESYLKEIDSMNIKSVEDMDTIKFRAASMDIFSIINKTIDLGDEINRANKMAFPGEYKDVFSMLQQQKIISEKMEKSLKDMVILRNKISHRYNILTKKDIFNAIKDLSIIKAFIKDIEKEVKNGKK